MTLEIHTLMQNADHMNAFVCKPKEEHMAAGWIHPITHSEVIAGTASVRIPGHNFHLLMDFNDIAIRLFGTPWSALYLQIPRRSARARGESV